MKTSKFHLEDDIRILQTTEANKRTSNTKTCFLPEA